MWEWGINCDTESLVDGTCTMDTNEVLWVHPKNKNLKELSVDAFSWFTMFIGTVVFIALVYSWMLMIFGGADEKNLEKWRKWIVYSLIWLLLVGFSYGIIRFIQLIAKW